MRTREEINQFLTEAMGECWHDIKFCVPNWYCNKCLKFVASKNNDFFDWNGFGKLWEWAKEKEWWSTFLVIECGVEENISDDLINPPHFARVLYKFLKKMHKNA